jgi:hypothetical protein
MIEALISVAAAAALGGLGWTAKSGFNAMKEGVKFRTSLNLGLVAIAKELSQFRNDVNKAMEQEQAAHRLERDEYRLTHQDFDKRIGLTEMLLARHDERISQVEDQVKANAK